MSLGELTESAGVSVRTVRYYIAEGLLPPPEGAGPQSAYTPGHLDRLRLIQRLKAAYLPLKEIRRRLAGLGDEAVRSLLGESVDAARDSEAPPPGGDVNLEEARKYLALLEGRESYRTEPMALRFDLAAPPAAAEQRPAPARRQAPRPAGVFPATPPHAQDEPATERELWRRIALGDEAELVISDRVYARHRERVDWLVRWARKVFR
jgi:DNA-binding transcriptional MerR regulator